MNNISSSKNYIVSYDPSNFKLKISNTDTSNKLFSLDFLQDGSIFKKAGFEKNYIIRLHLIWDLITYIKNIRDTYDLENADTLTSVCGLDIIKQFINTQIRTALDKPSKFYSSIENFNSICTLLKNALKLKPLLIIDDEYTHQETIKQDKRNAKRKTNNTNYNNNDPGSILDF